MGTIIFLGTCSGTEPMPGRHHSSVVFEINGTYYWFDAAEEKISALGIDARICNDGDVSI